jgi:hypothetical protein
VCNVPVRSIEWRQEHLRWDDPTARSDLWHSEQLAVAPAVIALFIGTRASRRKTDHESRARPSFDNMPAIAPAGCVFSSP